MSDPGTQVADAVRTGTVVQPISTDRSIGQLVASATAEMSALVHDEIALAKAELRQDVRRGAMGGAAITVAGVFALFSLPVLSFAAAYGIHNLGLGLAWSFLIVGGAYLVLAALAAVLALLKFKKVKPPEKTIASAKETAAVLQNVKPHPRKVGKRVKSVARSSA
ncbi:phage holin family protein [Streptomyces sp. NPDC059479]|uniref:phage holin family protein n=1 Tax=Streptomyces sp. NPDC059479 TaxID=3346848 RepID=UPI00367D7846